MSPPDTTRATPSPPLELPSSVTVVEVGPRDGFQMERVFIPTATKVKLIQQLLAAGLTEIEVTSFVSPHVIPQLADATEVLGALERSEAVRYWALVPNVRGAERGLAAGAGGVHVVVCVSETYNQRNVGLSVDDSLRAVGEIVELAGGAIPVAVTLAATFGCPFEGQLPDERILTLVDRCVDAGVDQVGLADSVGLGHPVLVRRLVRAVRARHPELLLRMHLHDTRGLGLANAVAALELGVTRFDTAFGGLGGCPLVAGATGNVATEDFAHLCRDLEVTTGVSLDGVRAASRQMEQVLGRTLPSRVLRAGSREELYARNRS